MTTNTAISIELWQLLTFLAGLMVAFFSATWAFAKVLLKQLDQRFRERDEKLNEVGNKIDEVEKDVLRLRAELPSEYVRREDWIRFSGTIDTKLDWLREKMETTRQMVAEQINRRHDSDR